MPKVYEGYQPSLEVFWPNLQDSFKAREKYYHRLTVRKIRDFGIETNLPKKLHDDGIFLDPMYKETILNKRPLLSIRWSQKEVVDIDTISQAVVDRTRKWLGLRIKLATSKGKQKNIPTDNP